VPMWYRTKTSNPASSRIRISLMLKVSLMGRTSHHSLPTSKKTIIRKGRATSVVTQIIGLLVARTALTSVHMGRAERPQMLSSAKLR
jgi:hypothetical protein